MKHKERLVRLFSSVPQDIADQVDAFESATNEVSSSSAIRKLIMKGLELHQLQIISTDPAKKQEFDEKLKELSTHKGIQNAMKIMKNDELENLINYAHKMKDKNVKQIVIDIHRS